MRSRQRRISGVAAAVAVAALAVFGQSAQAAPDRLKCPSGGTPAPGSTVTGGVEVDGVCVLTSVTVSGGIVVDETTLEQLLAGGGQNVAALSGATVSGGIVVESGSGLTTGIDLDTFTLTHNVSTIDGRVEFRHGGFFIAEATIRGGIIKDGAFDWHLFCGDDPFCFGTDFVCRSEVIGNISVNDVNSEQVFLGDPVDATFPNGEDCGTNTIHGSILMTNSNFVRFDGEPSEIEGETVTGSVRLDHSTAEVNGNTIGGSLLCANGTVIHPGPPPDPAGNTVRGTDTCG